MMLDPSSLSKCISLSREVKMYIWLAAEKNREWRLSIHLLDIVFRVGKVWQRMNEFEQLLHFETISCFMMFYSKMLITYNK